MSGGREGAVRAWDAAGAEGADVLAALDAGQGSQVSDIIHSCDQVRIHPLLTGGWFGLDGHQQCTGDGSGLLNRSLK